MNNRKLWWFLRLVLFVFVFLFADLYMTCDSYASSRSVKTSYIEDRMSKSMDFKYPIQTKTTLNRQNYDNDIDENIHQEDTTRHMDDFNAELESFISTNYNQIESYNTRYLTVSEEIVGLMSGVIYPSAIVLVLLISGMLAYISYFVGRLYRNVNEQTETKVEDLTEIEDHNINPNPSLSIPLCRHAIFQAAITKLNSICNESIRRTVWVLFAVEKLRRWITRKQTMF